MYVAERALLCESLSERSYANFRNFARDHERIPSALAANQPARAYELLAAHLDNAERGLVARLDTGEAEDPNDT